MGSETTYTNAYINMTGSEYLALGNSYTGTTWNTKFVGCMSDFRMYSTVLTTELIKELYDVSASIDKSGNVYAYEFMEE